MRIVFLPRAVADLEWFRRYYEDVFPDGRRHSYDRFAKARRTLAAMPSLGRPIAGAGAGVREYVIAGLPYLLIYRVVDDRIEILRLWDQRADRADNWINL